MKDQEEPNSSQKHKEITGKVIGCAFEVINELGSGFLESVYENALLIALKDLGLKAENQRPVNVTFREQTVGDFYADLLVEDKVLLELKAVKAILPEHQAQIINYLNATGLEVGLLINFGTAKLEFKRFTRTIKKTKSKMDGECALRRVA